MFERPLILTCEHASSDVPKLLAVLFKGEEALLATHRGFDPGSAELAGRVADRLRVPLECGRVTRLIVDLNRSEFHPRLFSKFTVSLHAETRQALLDRYYRPFRRRVFDLVEAGIERFEHVLHLSIHTFTPELEGAVRRADIGLLYDPSRKGEQALATRWRERLERFDGNLRVRFNYPYRGTSDGHVTELRSRFDAGSYLGIELEVNQNFVFGPPEGWERLQIGIADSLADLEETRER